MRPRIHDRTKIRLLADGNRSSSEIARETGFPQKFVQKVLLQENLPRLPNHSPSGRRNPWFRGGYTIDGCGYLAAAVPSHPNKRKSGKVAVHRIVMELVLGRLLTSDEVVDHINGLKLDNRLTNLRVFPNNAEHCRTTMKGKTPNWSEEGLKNIHRAGRHIQADERVSIYHYSRRRGDVRGKQILLLRESLDTDAISLSRKVLRTLLSQGFHPPGYSIPDHLL